MCPRSGLNGERRCAHPPDDDPERVDDRDAQDQDGHRHLGRAQDRQDGQGVADEHHAARAGEDRGREEVPAQEPGQGAGQGEAEHRHERLPERADRRRQADEPEGDGGDEPDARREPVEAVDEIHAVDHAQDPEHGEPGADDAAHVDLAAERARDHVRGGAKEDRGDRHEHLAGQLVTRPQLERVVQRPDDRRERASAEERDELGGADGRAAAG